MAVEHVRISGNERQIGEQAILETQLHLLAIVKQMRKFKALRKDELTLKLALKSHIAELEETLENIDRVLPETKYKAPRIPLEKDKTEKIVDKKPKEHTLDDEIDLIRKRLQDLRQSR